VIDDAATAFGARIDNKFIGSFNDTVTVFSLHANKIITSGEGGFISTNNDKLANKIRVLIQSGLSKDTWGRKKSKNYRILNASLPGFKFNFNDILASIAIVQIKKITNILNYRRRLKKRYLDNLKFLIKKKIIKVPFVDRGHKSALYNFQILFDKKKTIYNVANFLQKKKIETTIHYTPAHEHSFYRKKFRNVSLVNTNYFFRNSLSLPFHNNLSFKDIDFITKQLKKKL